MAATEIKPREGPTFGAIALFITAIVVTVVLVFGGTWYAVVNSNRNAHTIAANQQASDQRWCDILTLLTSNPVPPPGPHALPVQVRSYRLYNDFVKLRADFNCR